MWKPGKIFSFDTEGTGLDVPHIDAPFAFSFGNVDLETHYLEWDVDPYTRKPTPVAKDVAYMRKLLGSSKQKVAHNTPYDVMAMQAFDITVAEPYHDTYIQTKRVKTNLYNYGLKALGKHWLDMPSGDEEELLDVIVSCRRYVKKLGWNTGENKYTDYWLPSAIKRLKPRLYADKLPKNADKLCEIYCRKDSERAMLLHLLMNEILKDKVDEGNTGELEGYKREMKLMPIVIKMMGEGWRVHPDKIEETQTILEADIKRYKQEANKWADVPLEKFTNSTEAGLLYDDLGLENEECSRSVSRPNIENIQHPVINTLLDMRDAKGCINKFLKPFGKFSVKRGKELVMFPSFNQAGAKTFRFSAKRPPIQTIPDAGKSRSNMSARQCIGPRIGTQWYLLDYSSLQVRIFADLANDEVMKESLANGIKPHTTAARIAWSGEGNKSGLRIMASSVAHNKEASLVWCESNSVSNWHDEEQWEQIALAMLEESQWDIINAEKLIDSKSAYAQAKTMFFLKLFGGGAKEASKGLRCTLKEAKKTLREYGKAMPSIGRFDTETQNFATRNGYVETAFGDVIHIDPGYEYRGLAYIMQGTEAALVKDRMIALATLLKDIKRRLKVDIKILGTIHDELGFIAPKGPVKNHKPALREIKECMEDHTGHLTIDLPCEIDLVKKYWSDRIEVKV